MSMFSWHKRFPLRAIAVLSAAAALSMTSGVALAAYGPPPPPTGTPPGGYGCIITTRNIGPAGGTIGPLRDGRLTVTLTVPPGAFTKTVQVTITEPYSGFGPCESYGRIFGEPGIRLFGSVGVEVSLGNSLYRHWAKPLELTIGSIDIAGFQFEQVAVAGGFGSLNSVYKRRHEGPVTISVRKSEVLLVFVMARLPRRHRGPFPFTSTNRDLIGIPAAEALTSALSPADWAVPGLGVFQLSEGGSLLSTGRAQLPVSR